MRPLADEIRPQSLEEVAGQKHLLGEGALLRRLIENGTEANFIFYGPSGSPVTVQPGIWGLNTIVTPNIAQGTVLVGAFRQGASVLTKAGDGTRVEVVTGDHDDRTNNRVTVIVEERLGLAVRYPGAFVKIKSA